MSMRFLALTTALILLCGGCGTVPTDTSAPAESSSAPISTPEPSAPDQSTTPDVTKSTQPTASPDVSVPAPPPVVAEPDPTPAPEVQSPEPPVYEADISAVYIPDPQPVSVTYDFSAPVAECEPVENGYFADAAFVGDSRTEGFWLYSGVKQGKLLSAVGLTVFSVDSKIMTGGSQTVLDALRTGHYGKIYLAFGLNELGYIDTNSFVASYCKLIDTIRAAHPEAIIYIQNLIPVNDSQARASGHQGHVNCDRIRLYNEFIAQIAQEKQLPLLDVYSAFSADGQLPAEASRDGVHLLPAYCKKQLEYLKHHTVTQEQLTAPPVPSEPSVEPAAPAPEALPETEVTEI